MNLSRNTILIVDDSDEVRTIVRIFLERDPSFTVCGEAASGPEAIKKAQELKPDFVLLDLRLPGMNGIETATALKAILPQTKLVLFSAYADSLGNRTWASAIGVDLVVPKGSLIDMAASLKTLAKSA
jgi:DNA-binding NarL/FixJ family response regulator